MRPAGYPAELETFVRLSDGTRLWIRPVVPDDAVQLGQAYEAADTETLVSRFLGAPPRATPELLAHLTTVDYASRLALVAMTEAGHGVGIARYEEVAGRAPDGGRRAELAVTVEREWRHRGVGKALLEQLLQAARGRGITELAATYAATNAPIDALLRHVAGDAVPTISDGVAELVIRLDSGGGQPAAS